ncbi:vacuolar ATP synthase subunit C [Morchella conica CCBAS932]|uniref:V-type proton ATPase subunit C n=1 Tax=Morchella conica CCBAS932 TaxID=1392247 RepID=A0A3N4KRF8_9PEZI|nr:vacuolar ATP synthase subunit C [Morchella conica CCBAS932]
MSGNTYLLVALPSSISRSNDPEDAFTAIQSTVPSDAGTILRFPIPEFKIGTLDALVLQADELTKLDANVEGAVGKVVEVLRSIVSSPQETERHKTVSDKPVEHYLRSFSWNKVKYRSDKSIAELLDALQREVSSLDNDIKTKYTAYQQVKSNLVSVQRKQTGNLSTRSLASIVKKSDFVQSSEYLETLLIAVPKSLSKDWLRTYETLTPMVVPRSSKKIAEDNDYALFSVTLFKKHSAEFIIKARAARYTPREFQWREGAEEEDKREAMDVQANERRLYGDTLRLARTGYSDLFMAWTHVKALRVFVESVLRYGLPLDFVSVIIQTNPKNAKNVKKPLDKAYNYLGGNAFGRDKKGNIKDDVGDLATGIMGDAEYPAYCYFEFEVV